MRYLLFLFLFTSSLVYSQEKYVSIYGNDNSGDGTIDNPYRSINKALDNLSSGHIFIRQGRYREKVVINEKTNISIKPYQDEKVIIDGTIDLSNFQWELTSNNIFKTTIDQDIWQLFVNNNEMVMARWPNAQFSDKSIYDWDSWAEGDEDTSSNGSLVIDEEKSSPTTDNIDLNNSIGILNIGSFRTWAVKINNHSKNSGSNDVITYDTNDIGVYKDKHHYYFFEGKFDFLDNLNEWFFDLSTKELWLKTDGRNPNDMIIKGKVSSYGLNITNSSNITIKGLFFFSSTFSADSSDSVNIEDCTFSFPSTSKRMLGNLETPLASSLGLSGKKVNNSTIKKCLFEYTDGDALRVYGDNNTIENNYFQHIDYSVAELPGLMVSFYINGDKNIFTKNTIHNTQASATVSPGERSEFSYNKVSRTGALQSDGSVFQGTKNLVSESIVHHNLIFKTPKYAIRYDAPGDDPTSAGQNGKMFYNIAYDTGGIMVKGDRHYISHNTVLKSSKNGLIILAEENSNSNTYTQNNLVDKLSGHRSKSNYEDNDNDGLPDYPIPGISSNNWNGWDYVKDGTTSESNIINLIESLIDIEDVDESIDMKTNSFYPLSDSDIIDAGVKIDAISQDIKGANPDIGAIEYQGNIWKPGIDGWSPVFYPWNFSIDTDQDGVYDFEDQCPDTPSGSKVDTTGCPIFELPVNNYKVEVSSATCIGTSDGVIDLSVEDASHDYTVTITGKDNVTITGTNKTASVTGLAKGTYEVCFTVDGQSNYEQCFEVVVGEPPALTAFIDIDNDNRSTSILMTGSKKYNVTINGVRKTVTGDSFEANLSTGLNIIRVDTDLECQGFVEKEVFISEDIHYYPNPTSNDVKVHVGGEDTRVKVSVFSEKGDLIYTRYQDIADVSRKTNIDLVNQISGTYIVILESKTVRKTFKVIRE